MKTPKVDKAGLVREQLDKLKDSATRLNEASDQFGVVILKLEEQMKKMHLGVSGWVDITVTEHGTRGFGYARFNKKWGFAVRVVTVEGADRKEESWAFNDSPRWLRVEAVTKLPELLAHLVAQADTMISVMQKAKVTAEGFLSEMLTEEEVEDAPASVE